MKQKISVISVVHNEEKLIRRCLESVNVIADEILILHDGPCSDNTLKIAREYTNKVFQTKENVGVPGPIIPILLRKAKGPWILKLDADEFLSSGMKKAIPKLVQNPKADAYTFRWPFWNGKKYITKNWPRKPSLYRKDKISYIGFPHWDDPKINGKIIDTDFQLEHKPDYKGNPLRLKNFFKKSLKRYAKIQAEYTLKDPKELDSFQANMDEFPPEHFKIRKNFPLLSAIPIAIISFFKVLFSNDAWREGFPAFYEAIQSLIYYPYLGYLVYKMKREKV